MMFIENNDFDSTFGEDERTFVTLATADKPLVAKRDPQAAVLVNEKPSSTWVLYLLECQHDTYYCGITNNMTSRFQAHQSGKGARYTRANPPLRILAVMSFADRSAASRAEYQLKQQRKSNKINWIKQQATLNAQKLKENQL